MIIVRCFRTVPDEREMIKGSRAKRQGKTDGKVKRKKVRKRKHNKQNERVNKKKKATKASEICRVPTDFAQVPCISSGGMTGSPG